MRVFSFGGGVQSTAALVLAAQGEIEADAFLFANVGEDSENPATLGYVRDVALPYAERWSIPVHELRHVNKAGQEVTLYEHMTRPGSRSIGIPVYLAGSGAPANRQCTQRWKRQVIANWCWKHGARAKKPATVMLGISMDEWQRMRSDSGYSYTRLEYPLIDKRMSRQDCLNVITRAGLLLPPKSSCWFCPFHRLSTWREMRDGSPALFQQAVSLEQLLSERKKTISKRPSDGVFLTSTGRPLIRAVGEGVQPSLFDGDACESGYCMM